MIFHVSIAFFFITTPKSREVCNLIFRVLECQPCEAKSRLTLNLEDVFQNKIALSCFSQYMEAHGYGNIFNLLMEVENIPFKLATNPPKRTQSVNSSPLKTPPVSASSDTSFKNKSFNESCASPKKIFSQYISDDAPCKVRLPEELKNDIQSSCDNPDFGSDNLKEFLYQLIKKE